MVSKKSKGDSMNLSKKQNDLLKLGLVLILLSSCLQSMEYVSVCDAQKKCKQFSKFIMGTDHLIQANWSHKGQKAKDQESVFEVLDHALKNGINVFDTSPIYVGRVEKTLGQWLQSRKGLLKKGGFLSNPQLNPDRDIYVISKGGFPFDLYVTKKLPKCQHSKEFVAKFEQSAALGVPQGTYASRLFGSSEQIAQRVGEEIQETYANVHGQLSVYLLHRDDEDFFDYKAVERSQNDVSVILTGLAFAKIADKHWLLGFSNWRTERIQNALQWLHKKAGAGKTFGDVFNSPYFSLFEMSSQSIHAGGKQVFHKQMNDENFLKGVKMMPYSPLGGFSIFDRNTKDTSLDQWELAKNDAYEKYQANDPYWKNVYLSIFSQTNHERYIRLTKFLEAFNAKNKTQYTKDQLMNAYVLAHKRVDFLTIGPLDQNQIDRTIKSLELSKQLVQKELDYLYSGNNQLPNENFL